jgi:hypothetical protein
MRSLRLLSLAAPVAAICLFTAAASASSLWPAAVDFTAGHTFATTGEPSGGGVSLSVAPLWSVTDRLNFGVSFFADDIGTRIDNLVDPNDGTPLGAVGQKHRWTFGGAWHADMDLVKVGRWQTEASSSWGYWRIEDDVRGRTLAASSAVGFNVGGGVRRAVSKAQDLGVLVAYNRVFSDRQVAFGRVDRYASVALEWRWLTSANR